MDKRKLKYKLNKAHKLLKYGTDVLSPISKLSSKVSTLENVSNILSSVTSALNVEDVLQVGKSKWIRSSDFYGINRILAEIVMNNGKYTYSTQGKNNNTFNYYKMEGIEFAVWNYYSLYLKKDEDISKIKSILGRIIWETYSSNVRLNFETEDKHAERLPSLSKATLSKANSSELSNNIFKLTNKFIKKGLNRSIIFIGPPGAGKTTLCYDLAAKHKGFSISLNGVQAGDELKILASLTKVLRPNTVIVDDLDRVRDLDTALSSLEDIQNNTKLFLVTMNSNKDVPKAVLRPGRFDEIIEIHTIGDNVLKTVAADVPEEYFKQINKWPIAFVKELNNRALIYNKEELREEFNKLKQRVEENNKIVKKAPVV